MYDFANNFLSTLNGNVEIKRELRYCGGFKCKTIHFMPQGRSVTGYVLPSWTLCPVSGCCIYGVLSKDGKFTGENIAWVYPDYKHALIGTFEDGQMVEACQAVVSYKNVSNKGLLTLKFSKQENGEKLKYLPSTSTSLGGQNMIRDLYEDSMTYLSTSIVPEAGEGLFSRSDVPNNTLLSFYHGLNVPYEDTEYLQELYAFDDQKKLLNNVYKIKIDSNDTYFIDIPLEIGRNTKLYCASYGHKVNHSFKPNCRYRQMQHPRWGEIVGIFSTREIKKDEELLCNYGYEPEKYLVPEWYKIAYNKHKQIANHQG